MDSGDFDERDGSINGDWRFLPLVTGIAAAWFCAAALLAPVLGVVRDPRGARDKEAVARERPSGAAQ